MGAIVHCCQKEKEMPIEIIANKFEEEVKEREIEKAKIKIIQKYCWNESKVRLIQSYIRAYRFRKTIRNSLLNQRIKLNAEVAAQDEMYIDEGIDFDSLMHPLAKKIYLLYLMQSGVFEKPEVKAQVHQLGLEICPELDNNTSGSRLKTSDVSSRPKVHDIKAVWLNQISKIAYKGLFNEKLQPHGYGYLIKTDGSRYEGMFLDGKLHGVGRYFTIKGEFFEGDFRYGVATGRGIFIHPDNNVYIGSWHNDKTDGQGTEYFRDGSVFRGAFSNGKKNGKGFYLWVDGSKYEGNFKDDLLHGYGDYVWSDKSEYHGNWNSNLMNGQGLFLFSDGTTYEGDFINNKRSGRGTYKWNATRYHEGMWKDGKQHGKGKYYKDSELIEGIWKEGELINPKKPK